MEDAGVAGYSVREIVGYRNILTGKNTAIVERLVCGHEFVDGKFNLDCVYHASSAGQRFEVAQPKPVDIHRGDIRIHLEPKIRKASGISLMDMACMLCFPVLLFAFPPLVMLPIVYFIARLK
jgi:hypothetical protein